MNEPADAIAERLVRLESVLMHLGRDVEQMHQVLLAHQSEIESLRTALERLDGALVKEGPLGREPEIRDPAAEKPPHY